MKLTEKNYHSPSANRYYMSVSQFKDFERCQAAAMAELNGRYRREETPSMLVGSYVDAFFSGCLEQFREGHPQLYKKDGTLKAEYVQAEEIIQRIQRDRFFRKQLSGQKQVIMTGVIAGVPIKIKVDSLLSDRIVDLKIMKDFAPIWQAEKGMVPWFEAWGYDLQGAVYQEIVRQNTGKTLPFYLAAATKERITDIDVVHLPKDELNYGMELFLENVETYDAIKKKLLPPERCEKCDFCKSTKKLKQATEASEYYFA